MEGRSQPNGVPHSNELEFHLDERDQYLGRYRLHPSELMDEVIVKILRDFEDRAAREWEQVLQMDSSGMQRNLDEFLLSIGPQTGGLINVLVKEAKAQTILEVGSSYGYSTVWLAEAARETGGKVISLEIHPGKQESVRGTIARAGLSAYVD